jgi:TetR/AcrR family transcriptional regulator
MSRGHKGAARPAALPAAGRKCARRQRIRPPDRRRRPLVPALPSLRAGAHARSSRTTPLSSPPHRFVTDADSGPRLGQPLSPDEQTDRIVAAALAAFSDKGLTEASLTDIARRAGTSRAALLRHFPSKDELFREVVRSTLLAGMYDAGSAAAAPPACATAAEAVRAFAQRYWSAMERPELLAILRLVVGELPRFPELALFHATESLERLVRTLERIIEGGIARGELRAVDVRAAARTILATLAAHALWFAYPQIYAGLTGGDRARAAAGTIDTLLGALGAHGAADAPPPQAA